MVVDEVDLAVLWTARKLHYSSLGSFRAQVSDGGELGIEARARIHNESRRASTFEQVQLRGRGQRSH